MRMLGPALPSPDTDATSSSGPLSAGRPERAPGRIPAHLAVVMDGNGRWAEQRGLPRFSGHEVAARRVFEVIDGALQMGVRYLSVFAFSTENWHRSREEVTELLTCLEESARRYIDGFIQRGVRFAWCGTSDGLSETLGASLRRLERATAGGTALTYTMCINYGGRADLTQAARAAAREVRAGRLRPEDIGEATLARFLLAGDLPDVDLLIRPGGERRLSNFLLWHCAYAELHFTEELWPDFTRQHLLRSLDVYAQRDRRFGTAPGHRTSSPAIAHADLFPHRGLEEP